MEIGKFGSNTLFQQNVIGHSPLLPATRQALDAAKQNLAEVLGTVNPNSIKLGEIEKNDDKNLVGFEKPIENFVNWVDDKQHIAQEATFDVLSGRSDNLHQSVLATQEAGIAFTLLLEMRNKLIEGFKELTRMSI